MRLQNSGADASREQFPFPSPLAGEGGEIERSEMEPGEGAGSHPHVARRPLTRFARRCSLSTLSHDGEGV